MRQGLPSCCLLVLTTLQSSFAFHTIGGWRKVSPFIYSKNVGDFDDFEFEDISSSQELASEFYRQVRLRQDATQPDNSIGESRAMNVNDRRVDPSPRQNANDATNTGDVYGRKKMRLMGELDSTGTPSAGLFAREYGSVYSFPVERPREDPSRNGKQLLRSEFWEVLKVSSNELTLLIQGIVVLGSLIVLIYVGMTGGITDGSDRFGLLDGVVNEFNGLGEALDLTAIPNGIADALASENPGIWL